MSGDLAAAGEAVRAGKTENASPVWGFAGGRGRRRSNGPGASHGGCGRVPGTRAGAQALFPRVAWIGGNRYRSLSPAGVEHLVLPLQLIHDAVARERDEGVEGAGVLRERE